MPFTFAHPLYAAPLKLLKPKYVSLTGIILGSMSPDFEYFIMLEPYQSIGHTSIGLLLQAFPLSILFAFIFHFIIKTSVASHIPSLYNLDAKVQSIVRLHHWKLNNIHSWIVFLASVAAGFYSHVLLDAFTHQSGYFVSRFIWLQAELAGIPVYKILQHSLSLIGLTAQAIIILVIINRVKVVSASINSSISETSYSMKVKSKDKVLYWCTVIVVMMLTMSGKLLLSTSTNYIGMLVVSSISGCFLGVLAASIIYKLRSAISNNK